MALISQKFSLKKVGRAIVCSILERQARILRSRHDFKIVAVAGSMGKTSTKLAIAQVLEKAGLNVRYQAGNYNDRVTVPLVLFNQPLPNLLNIFAWVRVFSNNLRTIKSDFQYDVVVLELGTDEPGQIEKFSYLQPDLSVVTAVAPEHMEFFGSLDAVAEEELSVFKFSKSVLLNTDDIAEHYIPHEDYEQYGLREPNKGYYSAVVEEKSSGQRIDVYQHGKQWATQDILFLGTQGRKVVLAAAAVADMLGVERNRIETALKDLKPMAGRMQLLPGIRNSVLIDDTYNATPAAVEAALQVLVKLPNPEKIAVLGSMNELGTHSPESHQSIGALLKPVELSLIVTVGHDANEYLAPVAKSNGCRVVSVLNPHEAGLIVKEELRDNGVVLFKGSQNGVFAEEAIKPVLLNQSDSEKLVRQSEYWMRTKRQQFKLP